MRISRIMTVCPAVEFQLDYVLQNTAGKLSNRNRIT